MDIAVIGPGAIGGTVAAWLAQNSAHKISVCVRSDLPDGLVIERDAGQIAARPTVFTSPDEAHPVDWVLIATKTYDSAAAAAWLPSLMRDDTRIAVLQNGIEHIENFSAHAPRDRITPCIVDLPAERTGPGRILQRRDGSIVVPEGAAGEDFVALFAHTPIDVSTTDDFTTAGWNKLCINSAGAVSALTLKPAGVSWLEPIAEIMRAIVAECAAVGRAEGAALPDDIVERVVQHYRNGPRDSVTSIHADRLDGRPMEIDARNGVIVRLGARRGLATPVNAMVVALLEATMLDI